LMDSSTRTEKNTKRREKAQNQRALAYENVSPMKKNRKRAEHSVSSGSAASVSHCAAIQES